MASLARLLQTLPLAGPIQQQIDQRSVEFHASTRTSQAWSASPWSRGSRCRHFWLRRSVQISSVQSGVVWSPPSSLSSITCKAAGDEDRSAPLTATGESGSEENGEKSTNGSHKPVRDGNSVYEHRAPKIVPWLIVGLGNPGRKFVGTRHNVGFDLVDRLAKSEGISFDLLQCNALVGQGHIADIPVLLVKPQTYMSLSGEAVSELVKEYRVPVQRLFVICSDLDLATATLTLKPRGGHAGHNGMKSVIESMEGCKTFPRLRIGIGKPPAGVPVEAYVLQRFSADEKVEMDLTVHEAQNAVRAVLVEGMEKAMKMWNIARSFIVLE